jgi:S-formylglutathione hydrolase FrmB
MEHSASLRSFLKAAAVGQPVILRRHSGYDHGYYFIATFVSEHLDHHAMALTSGLAGNSHGATQV